jgi:hypothetical protein
MKYRTAHRADHHGVWLPAGITVEVGMVRTPGELAGLGVRLADLERC